MLRSLAFALSLGALGYAGDGMGEGESDIFSGRSTPGNPCSRNPSFSWALLEVEAFSAKEAFFKAQFPLFGA